MKKPSNAPRILGGEFKGRAITTPPGRDTRPLRVLARRSLFDKLGHDLDGARVLDLFAGAGTVGLEAVSRGARRAVLVDMGAPAQRALRETVETFGIHERVVLERRNALDYVTRCEPGSFDFIFLGPPYPLYKGEKRKGLTAIFERLARLLDGGGVLVLESPAQSERPAVPGLSLMESRSYGDTLLNFFHHLD